MITTETRLPPEDQLVALVHLKLAPNMSDRVTTTLMRRLGSPRAAFETLLAARPDTAAFFNRPEVRGRIDHALRWIRHANDVSVLVFGSDAYPETLTHLRDPPPVVFARGNRALLERQIVAIVGTRANTEYGADVTRMLAAALVRADMVVLSGLAHGIDRIAHEATLDLGGATAAVVGTGIDVCYPLQHEALQECIARDGLVLSEFLPGEPALPYHFPQRNRIIAALAKAVIVVEAPRKSGALITAEQANDLGRDLWVVPGPIGRRTSEGTNALIADGASILTDPEAAVAEISNGAPPRPRPESWLEAPTDVPVGLWTALGDEPTHVDELAERADLPLADVLGVLFHLELQGLARQSAGLRFSRV